MEHNRKKKFIFISPFERYKRVMPMIAEQEKQDRQKQDEEEEERLNKLKIKDASSSIFKTGQKSLSDQTTSDQSSSLKKNQNFSIPLKQMPGRKRKRDSSVRDSSDERSDSNLSTPIPSLNKKIMQGVNKELLMTEDTTNEQNKQLTVQTVSYDQNLTVKPLRY